MLHVLLHLTERAHWIRTSVLPILRMRKLRVRRWPTLCKVPNAVSEGHEIYNQTVWVQSPCSLPSLRTLSPTLLHLKFARELPGALRNPPYRKPCRGFLCPWLPAMLLQQLGPRSFESSYPLLSLFQDISLGSSSSFWMNNHSSPPAPPPQAVLFATCLSQLRLWLQKTIE